MDTPLTCLAGGSGLPPWHSPPGPMATPVVCPAPHQDMRWKAPPALSNRGRLPGTSAPTWCSLVKCGGTTVQLGGRLGGGNRWKHRSYHIYPYLPCTTNTVPKYRYHLYLALTWSQGCKQLPKMLDEVEVTAVSQQLGPELRRCRGCEPRMTRLLAQVSTKSS